MTVCAVLAGEQQLTCRMTSVAPCRDFLVDPQGLTCVKETDVVTWSFFHPGDIRLNLDPRTVALCNSDWRTGFCALCRSI